MTGVLHFFDGAGGALPQWKVESTPLAGRERESPSGQEKKYILRSTPYGAMAVLHCSLAAMPDPHIILHIWTNGNDHLRWREIITFIVVPCEVKS
jgi:hypothetical protein